MPLVKVHPQLRGNSGTEGWGIMERSWSLTPWEVSESLRDQGRQWLKDHGVTIPQDSSKHGVEQARAYQEN